MMDLDEAIQSLVDEIEKQAILGHIGHVENLSQMVEWLKELKVYKYNESDCGLVEALMHSEAENEWLYDELKAYRDARAEIAEAFNDDARGEQNDYERGRKSGIFLCESIISVKLGESSSEIPNTCGDAISRQAVLDAMYALCGTGETLKENPWRDNPHIDAITDAIDDLPSVTPQQRTGRWERMSDLPNDVDDRFKCSHCGNIVHYNNVMDLRTFSRWCGRCGSDNG